MQPQVIAAIIAAAVSVLGVAVSVLSAQWAIRSAREKLLADAEALRQNLLKDVLAKRMAAYAAVWKIIITYDLNWKLEGKHADAQWSMVFLRELNACNAEHGVFFSESVYTRLVEYRACLVGIAERARASGEVSEDDLQRLATLSAGKPNTPGLATALKDDLGSYIRIHLQVGK
jgi:hypothetical protein